MKETKNKYQEALDNIVRVSCPKGKSCGECDNRKICNCEAKSYIDTLQELVDKTASKKVIDSGKLDDDIKIGKTTFCKGTNALKRCPNCHKYVNKNYEENYCGNCGQAMDWSDDNE